VNVEATFTVRGGGLADFRRTFGAIVDKRTKLIDAEVRRQGWRDPYILVNASEARTYANTKLFDVVQVYADTPPVVEAMRGVMLKVVGEAPTLTGTYRDSFVLLLNGRPITALPARVGPRSNLSLVNLARHASPLEALRFMARSSLMYGAALFTRALYPSLKVSFSYRLPHTIGLAQRASRSNSYPTAVPVIEIGGSSSNVRDGAVRPVSPRALRRARDRAAGRP